MLVGKGTLSEVAVASIEMVECPICSSKLEYTVKFSFPGNIVIQCRYCNTRILQPFVLNEPIHNEDNITSRQHYFGGTNVEYASVPELRAYLDVKGKKILDVGCATGSFLKNLVGENEVLGMEVSAAYEPYLKRENIPYVIGHVESILPQIPDSTYDLITLWDVFEHLENPRKILLEIKRILAPDGVIINWTNNYIDYISYFAEVTYKMSFGKYYALMDQSFNRAGGHNYNFTPQSLEMLYGEAGLIILKTIITDTPAERLTQSSVFRAVLKTFYMANRISGYGKIVCHALALPK
jgi:ubiquinone/menaquinone biosynthesis C-methylase UbiE